MNYKQVGGFDTDFGLLRFVSVCRVFKRTLLFVAIADLVDLSFDLRCDAPDDQLMAGDAEATICDPRSAVSTCLLQHRQRSPEQMRKLWTEYAIWMSTRNGTTVRKGCTLQRRHTGRCGSGDGLE